MIKGILKCAVYISALGVIFFFLGRLLPKEWFKADRFPFKSFKFENNGRIYDKLNIRKWQSRLPDMSRLFPRLMHEKKLSDRSKDIESLPLMIQETCIAESTHVILFFLGFGCMFLWRGLGGFIAALIYNLIGNVPYIIIQRYNRPRLLACQQAAVRASRWESAAKRSAAD